MRKAITEDRVASEAFDHWQNTDENDEPKDFVVPYQPPHLDSEVYLDSQEVELLSEGETLVLLRYEADADGNLTFSRVTE